MNEIDNDENIRELKRLHDDGLLKDEDLVEKLKEILKKKESLRDAITEQKNANIDIVLKHFTVHDLLLLINYEI
ncbi:hypothetical protein KORDIASMS9_02248 [Kordia sp. SMS9]|uniref:hypothetical protein n=1 Tax=Kordia sp. SMS9 TaxID=2282170 RepID=UPI000E0CCA32|nr:hypothetical protein [Kordia sp. SMS9]AXG70019.1 hypothetical protein KORDIASMS9_02248 [Kordia sp. SMS9]